MAGLIDGSVAGGTLVNGGIIRVTATPTPPPTPGGATIRVYLDARLGLYTDTAGTTPVTTDGDLVAAWRDQSSNAYLFTQSTSGKRPIYKTTVTGQDECVQWTGGTSMYVGLAAGVAAASLKLTVFSVFRRNGLAPAGWYSTILAPKDVGDLVWGVNDAGKQVCVRANQGVGGTGTATISDLTWVQANVAWNRTDGTLRLSSAADGTINIGGNNAPATILNVGQETDTLNPGFWATTAWRGQMALFLAYNEVLSLSDIQTIEAWITSEFGV